MEPRELVATTLWCWSSFERLVAELYDRMAGKVSDGVLSLSLRWLSSESRSHSLYLENLLDLFGGTRENGCDEFVGVPWSAAERALEKVAPMERLDRDTALEILRELQPTERLVSEEVYSAILSNMLKDLSPLLGADARLVTLVLEEISEEESYHERIVAMLIEHLSRGHGGL